MISQSMACPKCAAEIFSDSARFCTKCGSSLFAAPITEPPKDAHTAGFARLLLRALVLPFILVWRVASWWIEAREARIRWLAEAAGPESPIMHVHGLSDGAKRVYKYLADVTYRFGGCAPKIITIGHAAGLSENGARNAIRELEHRRLLSHRRRNTWHGRGAHEYYVKPVRERAQRPR
jgi:zinc ribbon protein/helix-turn-helix protein